MTMHSLDRNARPAPPASAEFPKRLATLQAHCALDGVVFHAINDAAGHTLHVVTKASGSHKLEEWLGRAVGVAVAV